MTYSLIKTEHAGFISEYNESLTGNIEIWLKSGYVLSTTGAACDYFNLSDYESQSEMIDAINRTISDELTRIDEKEWQDGSGPTNSNTIDRSPIERLYDIWKTDVDLNGSPLSFSQFIDNFSEDEHRQLVIDEQQLESMLNEIAANMKGSE